MSERLSTSSVAEAMRYRLPEIFVVVAVLFVVGQLIDGNLLLGLFLGTVWLFAAGFLYHQRNQPPEPPDDRP